MQSYAERLKTYIQNESLTCAMYKHCAGICPSFMTKYLRSMADDEYRHLKAMQLEFFLLTGDTLPPAPLPVFDRDLCKALRLAYSGEWSSSCDYAAEAEKHEDEKTRSLFLAQSRDELRHRCLARRLIAGLTGMMQ